MSTLASAYLFVPGDRPERFAKAVAADPGMVVLDLEDAVNPESKTAARASVASILATAGFRACIRLNGADTAWFAEDCRLLKMPGVAGVMLPKAEDADVLALLRSRMNESAALIPIVETAKGLAAARRLAATLGVQRLAFGSVDFQLDLGIEGDDTELLYARSQLVLASRVANIAAPIDGVTLAVKDDEQLIRDAARARRLGFRAKLCIHPAQVAPVKSAFQPSAADVAWAHGVLQATAGSSAGALVYQGKLVDKPVLERARAILQIAA